MATFFMLAAEAAGDEKSKTLFYVLGGAFASWAVILTAIGMSSPSFPGSTGGQRAIIAISLVLMAGAIGSAIATG